MNTEYMIAPMSYLNAINISTALADAWKMFIIGWKLLWKVGPALLIMGIMNIQRVIFGFMQVFA